MSYAKFYDFGYLLVRVCGYLKYTLTNSDLADVEQLLFDKVINCMGM